MTETLRKAHIQKIEICMPNPQGLQLRLAVQFAQCMQEFQSEIQVRKGELSADGKNIWELLLLAAAWKARLEIKAMGKDATEAIESIETFFTNQENLKDVPLLKVDCQQTWRTESY